ncbi:MAG: tyrosine-type recombinase/integrase [Deltaproteobacteria bacterium]|nr:tyrosine-type recombinase/integrase [Deltaproteobacteria bacterium]
MGVAWGTRVTDPRQKICFHTCRHTHASWLAMAGVDLYTIAQLLGHRSLEMTQRYSHPSPDHLTAAVNKLGNQRARIPGANRITGREPNQDLP